MADASPSHAPGLIWAYRFDKAGRARPAAGSGALDLRAADPGFRWLHVQLVDPAACSWIEAAADLPGAARELLRSSDSHQRLVLAEGVVCAVLHDFAREPERDRARLTAPLHVVLGEGFLITGRHEQALSAMGATRQAVDGGRRLGSPVALLEAIAAEIGDRVAARSTEVCDALEAIEDAVIGESGRADLAGLSELRRRIVQLHRQLHGLQAVFHRIEREPEERLPAQLREVTAGIAQRLDSVAGEIGEFEQRARLLADELDCQLNRRTNHHLYVLSVVTALFLPPTLVTGMFGMNTDQPLTVIPHGFFVALLLVSASPLLVYTTLRARGLFRR